MLDETFGVNHSFNQINIACNMSRYYFQKQPSKSNFLEMALRHGCSPVNLLHIFRIPFPRNTPGWMLLYFVSKSLQEISIIIILIFCLNFHASKCPYHQYLYLLLIYYQKSDGINEIY